MKRLLCSIFLIIQFAAIYSKPALALSLSLAPSISFVEHSIYTEAYGAVSTGFLSSAKNNNLRAGASISAAYFTSSNIVNRKFLPNRINARILFDLELLLNEDISIISSLHLGYMHYQKINAGELEGGISSGLYGKIAKNLYIGIPLSLSISKGEKRLSAEISLRLHG